MADIMNGKTVSASIRDKIKLDVEHLKDKYGVTPGLAVILVGDDPASQIYVRNKHKACTELGINSYEILLDKNVSESELIEKIEELNIDNNVHGILVQLPLPKHISEENVINAISKDKDVDAFHPYNVGKILTGDYTFAPCTPSGIISILDYYNVSLTGKKCAVIGRSNIVGKPMALLLLERNATVTVCHSKTTDITAEVKQADVVIVAVGRPEFIKGHQLKDGAVVIDVGINRTCDGKLVGDVEFSSASKVASLITPVPGGVGPMTITSLMQNTVKAAKKSIGE